MLKPTSLVLTPCASLQYHPKDSLPSSSRFIRTHRTRVHTGLLLLCLADETVPTRKKCYPKPPTYQPTNLPSQPPRPTTFALTIPPPPPRLSHVFSICACTSFIHSFIHSFQGSREITRITALLCDLTTHPPIVPRIFPNASPLHSSV